jgi:hypothetical protein
MSRRTVAPRLRRLWQDQELCKIGMTTTTVRKASAQRSRKRTRTATKIEGTHGIDTIDRECYIVADGDG